jgi:N-acetylmuramic acid 6-phosphate etherase
MDRSHVLTETRLPDSENLDAMTVEEQVRLMHEQDLVAVRAVGAIGAEIARAVRLITARLEAGGRLFHIGAGTSGRLGVLDASEIPPTFRADPTLVQGVIAGGPAAILQAQEGAEDNPTQSAHDLTARGFCDGDVLVGIAAGGTTPYVLGGLSWARAQNAGTIFLSCVQPLPTDPDVDVTLRPVTGPEVITGSTRLKAGTATKLVLNTLTTLTMVALGKTHGNLMVDLKASNAKLRDRALRLITTLTPLTREQAAPLLDRADGHAKLAIAMHHLNATPEQATKALQNAKGNLRRALTPPPTLPPLSPPPPLSA